LVDSGDVKTREVGSRGRVWWIPANSESPVSGKPGDKADQGQEEDPDQGIEAFNGPEEIIEEYRYDIPARNDEQRHNRAEAIYEAYKHLQEEGQLTNTEIKEHTYEQHPDGSNPERQWVNYVRDVLSLLPGVQMPPRGATMWQYIEPDSGLDDEFSIDIDPSVADADVPGEGEIEKRYRAMIQIVYNFLKEEGEGRRGDFERILPEYTGHYTNFEGVWSYFFRDALASLPGVEKPPRGGRVWSYVDPEGELAKSLDANLEDSVAAIDTPGSGESDRRFKSLLQIAYDHLKETTEAEKEDFREALPDYTGHYSDFDGLWGYFLKDALTELEDVSLENSETSGPSTYVYSKSS